MSHLSRFFRFITALTGCLVIFIFAATKWLTATFGKNISIDQILFHLVTPQAGVSREIAMRIACFLLIFAAGGDMVFSCLQN